MDPTRMGVGVAPGARAGVPGSEPPDECRYVAAGLMHQTHPSAYDGGVEIHHDLKVHLSHSPLDYVIPAMTGEDQPLVDSRQRAELHQLCRL